MINKILKEKERKLDAELKKRGIKPNVYHFREDVAPFTAIAIVDETVTWETARRVLDMALEYKGFRPATHLLKELREIDHIQGVTVCDGRDAFNRWRGRNIAKGRLLKHLKEMEND